MISEKLLALVGETEKLDELKAIIDEVDVLEAKVAEVEKDRDTYKTRLEEVNEVNRRLLLSSFGKKEDEDTKEKEEKDEEPDFDNMSDEEIDEFFSKNRSTWE